MNDVLIKRAKVEAKNRGKSVSQMVGEFIDSLGGSTKTSEDDLPPVTASLLGLIKGQRTAETAYKKHLSEKYG